MRKFPHPTRDQAVAWTRKRLQLFSFPRLQMMLLILLTALAGFLASFSLLHAGVLSMWLRYPLAVLLAYGVFLLLLWLWLRTDARDWGGDIPIIPGDGSAQAHCETASSICGQGGEFGGGGAQGSFGDVDGSVLDSVGDQAGEALGGVASADEAAIPLLAIGLVLAFAAVLCFSSLYVVYIAPTLFAELLVDGVLATSLYFRIRGIGPRHWLEPALERTWWPFLLTAVMLSGLGWLMSYFAPGTHTLFEVWRLLQT